MLCLYPFPDQCTRTQEDDLVDILFRNYNPIVRPICNASEAVQVELALGVSNILELVRFRGCEFIKYEVYAHEICLVGKVYCMKINVT